MKDVRRDALLPDDSVEIQDLLYITRTPERAWRNTSINSKVCRVLILAFLTNPSRQTRRGRISGLARWWQLTITSFWRWSGTTAASGLTTRLHRCLFRQSESTASI